MLGGGQVDGQTRERDRVAPVTADGGEILPPPGLPHGPSWKDGHPGVQLFGRYRRCTS